MGLLDDEKLAKASWDELIERRLANPQESAALAPYEHRAFAREKVGENPLLAPVYLAMAPGYQLVKALGYKGWDGKATGPSMEQLKGGLLGTWEGVKNAWNR